ncbi:MAG: hypothetical protein HY999_03650 [Nitrospinae bacterium]|nr:hypothetical protein [Nitrospinota bacterium]
MSNKSETKEKREKKVKLNVDGKDIELNSFVEKIFKSTILGLIKPLKGVKNPKKVSIKID